MWSRRRGRSQSSSGCPKSLARLNCPWGTVNSVYAFAGTSVVSSALRATLRRSSCPDRSGIFNVGSGQASTFNEVANAIIDWHGKGEIVYIPFPEQLKDSYQSFTEADIGALTAAGYEAGFMDVRGGVSAYLKLLDERK